MSLRYYLPQIAAISLLITIIGYSAKGPQNHNLGPTGLQGTIANNVITITKVDKGSPADGKLKKGDQVIGIGDSKFKQNVRKELAAAINEAETKEAGGKLTLTLKDDKPVELQLTVLGSYSETAPYDCPKSDAIITRAADFLVKEKKFVPLRQDLLGLLATGEDKYIDVVKDVVKAELATSEKGKKGAFVAPDAEFLEQLLKGDTDAGYVTWGWGYPLIFLCEYYLMTKDESVLPTIRAFAVTFARGQDPGGLFGHRLATVKRNNRLPGYAQMNQPSLTCFMGMLLAQKCGIDDPKLAEGVERSYRYFESFVGRGSFNYGVHGPNSKNYNNNGTSGSATICMSLKGNKEGVSFFSTLSSTSYDGLETGHTGHFFNVMWTPLGANLAGPEVTKRFFKKSFWLHTLYRDWDGSFSFDGGEYKRTSSTGAHLLAYCLPRKKLIITGKEADESIWKNPEQAEEAIGLSHIDFKSKTTAELLKLVNHPIPQVRRGAGWNLRERREEILPKLDELMKNGTNHEKEFAVGFNGYPQEAAVGLPYVDKIGAVLREEREDISAKIAAVAALAYVGEPGQKYYMDVVKLIAEDRPDDLFGDADWGLGGQINKLCKTPFGSGLVTDKDLFYKAAIKLIENKRQHVRADGLRMLADMPLEDFHRVADKVVHVIEDKDPTYHSYHSPGGPIGAGVAVLAHLNIKEGMDMAMGILDIKSGKGSFKLRAVMDSLAMYGGNAKPYLEKLKTDPRFKGVPTNGKLSRNWNNMVKAIEGDKNPPQLITLEEAKKAGK